MMSESADVDLWTARASASAEELRSIDDRLVRRHSPLVERIAGSMLRGNSKLRLDDLYSDGLTGLHEAIKRYSPAAGVKFHTFAQHRIRGAMLDGVRSRDYASRYDRKLGRAAKQVNRGFALAGTWDDEELSPRFHPRFTSRSSLEGLDDLDAFRERCRRLPRRERQILELRFCENLKLTEIGQTLGLAESRVSQILGGCLRQLRAEISCEES